MTWLEILLTLLLYLAIGAGFSAAWNERCSALAVLGWPLWLAVVLLVGWHQRRRK